MICVDQRKAKPDSERQRHIFSHIQTSGLCVYACIHVCVCVMKFQGTLLRRGGAF